MKLSDRINQPALWILAIALALLSLFPFRAEAGSITSTWRAPSLYTDGSTITDPITYRMEYGPEGGDFSQSVIVTTTTGKADNLAPGRWCNRIVSIVNRVDGEPTVAVCVTVPPKDTPPPVTKKPNPAYGLSTQAAP